MAMKLPSTVLTKLVSSYNHLWKPPPKKPPYNHICRIGDPVLRYEAKAIDVEKIKSEEIQKVISKMKKVMRNHKAVGLAAPQIGCSLRVITMEFSPESLEMFPPSIVLSREYQAFPLQVFVNPVMRVVEKHKVTFPEACECIKGYSALVPRYYEVKITGYNEKAEEVEWQVKGWPARIIQHELDHINGKLYTDIMVSQSFQYDFWYQEHLQKWFNIFIRK
ncbi:peptide deformylase, mitochondrial-like isoform X2 [Limulus polyphemus]|uniref:Peptide deformylase n=1 Tax=Limulus polyphemus TaxID=6850 RepID=A0ABM1BEY0_LIMPO|nr:peptide deformylase, mitochondrial-like isoform X2 [Limulus polyphemus]